MSGEPIHAEWIVSSEPTPFAMVPEELIYDVDVQHGAVRLWAALQRHANRKGEAWPSLRTLATKLGVNRTTVMRWRDHLDDLGWLKYAHDLDADGNPIGRVRVWLFWTRVDPATGVPVHQRTGGSHERNTQSHERNGGVAPAQRHLIESQEREPPNERTPSARVARATDADRVWAHWLDVATRSGALRAVGRYTFTPGRREAVMARLRQGYTADQLCTVVDAAFRSEHHRSKARYLDLSSICGNAKKVDGHLAAAELSDLRTDDRLAKAQATLDRTAALAPLFNG